MKNVIETARESGHFSMLITIVQETGLIDTLSSDGPFTIFAPTDDAFAKLSKKTIDHLLQDKERLTEILTYHVIQGRISSQEVQQIGKAQSIQGSQLIFDATNSITVNKSTIIKSDIQCDNGIIHIIDEVLIPK